MYPCSSRLHFLCFFHHRAPPMKQHKVGNPQQRGRATAKQNNQIQLILFNGLIKEASVEESGRGGLDANLNLPPIGLTLLLCNTVNAIDTLYVCKDTSQLLLIKQCLDNYYYNNTNHYSLPLHILVFRGAICLTFHWEVLSLDLYL